MAETKKTEKIERVYVVPLRKHFRKAPKYKRSKRAMNALKAFIVKHMKTPDIKIGKELNEVIYANGFKNPPHKVKIGVVKEDNIAKANIEGTPYKDFKPQEAKKPESMVDKLQSKLGGKKKASKEDFEAPKLEKKEEKKEEPKKEEKSKEKKSDSKKE